MTEEFNKDLQLVAFHAPAYVFDDIRMTSTGHGKSYIKMYWITMPPSNAQKSGKAPKFITPEIRKAIRHRILELTTSSNDFKEMRTKWIYHAQREQ